MGGVVKGIGWRQRACCAVAASFSGSFDARGLPNRQTGLMERVKKGLGDRGTAVDKLPADFEKSGKCIKVGKQNRPLCVPVQNDVDVPVVAMVNINLVVHRLRLQGLVAGTKQRRDGALHIGPGPH